MVGQLQLMGLNVGQGNKLHLTTNDLKIYAYCPKLYFKSDKQSKIKTDPLIEFAWTLLTYSFAKELETDRITTWQTFTRYIIHHKIIWEQIQKEFPTRNIDYFHQLYKFYCLFKTQKVLAINYPCEVVIYDIIYLTSQIPIILGSSDSYEIILNKNILHSIESKIQISSIAKILGSKAKAIHLVLMDQFPNKIYHKKVFLENNYYESAEMEIKNIITGIKNKVIYSNDLGCSHCNFFGKCR